MTILALEAERQLPAQREEVVEALEEGITLLDSTLLRAVTEQGADGLRLECVRVSFEPSGQGGPSRVTPREGGDFTLGADAIVSAIGHDPELGPWAGALATAGTLLKADARGATSVEGVWAGGDVASMARFVTEAFGMGERAALDINRRLRGCSGTGAAPAAGACEAPVALAAINLYYHPTQPRPAGQRRALPERLAQHAGLRGAPAEVQLGLDIEQALAEAARCFSCGLCTHCDNCVNYCPDFAVQRAGDGYSVSSDYCKGCGLCVRECPTGSMKMVEEMR